MGRVLVRFAVVYVVTAVATGFLLWLSALAVFGPQEWTWRWTVIGAVALALADALRSALVVYADGPVGPGDGRSGVVEDADGDRGR